MSCSAPVRHWESALIVASMDKTPISVVPIPDPTVLTTAQLYREISALREVFDTQLGTITRQISATEVNRKEALLAASESIQRGLDKAEKSITVSIDKVQNDQRIALTDAEKRVNEKFDAKDKAHDEKINQLRMLNEEKFRSIETQFIERDKRTEQLSLADKTAIAAALQAQKEAAGATNESNKTAIAKSEVGFTKQIDQIGVQITAMVKSFDDKINDVKSRLDRGEGHSGGIRDGWGYVVGVIGIILAIAAMFWKH